VLNTLYRALAQKLNRSRERAGAHKSLEGVENVGSRFSFTREDIAIRINFDKSVRLESIAVTPFFTYHGR